MSTTPTKFYPRWTSSSTFKPVGVAYAPPPPFKRSTARPASLHGGVDTAAAPAKPSPVYTGTELLGIGTLHKSNAVPVFTATQAVDLATMRRS